VLWSADVALSDADCRDQLDNLESLRLAIANPQTAPYGVAAMQFLMRADLWNDAQDNLVFGGNIAQTLQFVSSKNANLGLIAASQAMDPRLPAATCQWAVPPSMHDPIEQQAILIKDGEVGRAFLEFLESADAQEIIRAYGYEVPDFVVEITRANDRSAANCSAADRTWFLSIDRSGSGRCARWLVG